MAPKKALQIYLAGIAYAALMYLCGPLIPLATIVLGFGLLIIPYLALEWLVTPALALLLGFQSRWWSVPLAILLGAPLVLLFTVITPVVDSGSASMNVAVPWLATYAKSKASIGPVIVQRLLWWGTVFIVSLLIGWASRQFWPSKRAS